VAVQTAAYGKRAFKTDRRKKSVRSWRLSFPLIAAAAFLSLLIASFFVKTWVSHKTTMVGYEINLLEKENRKLQEEHQKLTVELSNLTSLSRIERIATQKLGLKVPSPEQIVKVR